MNILNRYKEILEERALRILEQEMEPGDTTKKQNKIWYVCKMSVMGKNRKITNVLNQANNIKKASEFLEKARERFKTQIETGKVEVSILDSTESDPKKFMKNWNEGN